MPRYRITISGPDKAAMADLVRKHAIEVFDHGIRFAADTGYSVAAYATPDQIRLYATAGLPTSISTAEIFDAAGRKSGPIPWGEYGISSAVGGDAAHHRRCRSRVAGVLPGSRRDDPGAT